MQQRDVDPADLISTTSSVDIDLTTGNSYQELVTEEIEHYSKIEATDLEQLIRLELEQIETGKLKPTEMFDVFRRIKQQ